MKWYAALMLLCMQLAAQQTYVVHSSGHYMGLKTTAGEEILAPVYEKLGWSDGSTQVAGTFIGYRENEKWGLLSIDGKRITEARYDKLEPLLVGSFKVGTRGKFTNLYFYGIIDSKGKQMLPQEYFDVKAQDDLLLLTVFEQNRFRYGALSPEFRKILPVAYTSIEAKGNLLVARDPAGHYGLFSRSGVAIFDDLEEVEERRGRLLIRRNGAIGLVDFSGEILHQPVYKDVNADGDVVAFPQWKIYPGDYPPVSADSVRILGPGVWFVHANGRVRLYHSGQLANDNYLISQLQDGFAVVQAVNDGKWYALDAEGNPLLHSADSIHFDGAVFYALADTFWRVYDRKGHQITERQFDEVRAFGNGLAAVKKFGYWALLEVQSRRLSDFRYDAIASADEAGAVVKYVGRWGVHAAAGWAVAPAYDTLMAVQGRYLGTKGSGHFLFNSQGDVAYQTIDRIVPADGYFQLRDNGHVSALAPSGKPVANTEYRSVEYFEGFVELQKPDTTELYTPEGRRILSKRDEVDDVLGYAEDFFLVRTGPTYGFVDTDGKLRIANRYDSAQLFSDGRAAVKLRNRWGFIDKAERLVVQPHYDWVSPFVQSVSIFRIKKNFGLLDAQGQELITGFQHIQQTPFGNYILQSASGTFGLANASGRQLLSPTYEFIRDLGSNRILVKLNGRMGVVDYTGRVVVPFEYSDIRVEQDYLLLRLP